MNRYKNDPRSITAKFISSCSKCKGKINKGEPAFYWPASKTIMCLTCGEPEYRDFLSLAADEDVYNRSGNPYYC